MCTVLSLVILFTIIPFLCSFLYSIISPYLYNIGINIGLIVFCDDINHPVRGRNPFADIPAHVLQSRLGLGEGQVNRGVGRNPFADTPAHVLKRIEILIIKYNIFFYNKKIL